FQKSLRRGRRDTQMGYATIRNQNGAVVCARCALAVRPLARMKGLLGRDALEPGEGILLRPAGSIHMLFMRFPIDAIFCDRNLGATCSSTRFRMRRSSTWSTARVAATTSR